MINSLINMEVIKVHLNRSFSNSLKFFSEKNCDEAIKHAYTAKEQCMSEGKDFKQCDDLITAITLNCRKNK